MTAFAPGLAMSKMHRTVKEIKGARKESENERGGMEQPRFSLSLPGRNMSRCETAVRHLGCALRCRIRVLRGDEEDGTPSKEDERCKERGSKTLSSYGMALSAACTNFVMLMQRQLKLDTRAVSG